MMTNIKDGLISLIIVVAIVLIIYIIWAVANFFNNTGNIFDKIKIPNPFEDTRYGANIVFPVDSKLTPEERAEIIADVRADWSQSGVRYDAGGGRAIRG